MTLNAWKGPQLRGVAGPAYQVGPWCSNPGCRREAQHAHHIFRRTDQRLGAPFDWVEIKGVVYQNKTGVCARCHDDLTGSVGGHRAAIKIVGPDYDWTWMWCTVHESYGVGEVITPLAPIEPQPLTPEALALSRVPDDPWEPEKCPTCGHVTRARPTRTGGRARKSWTILVPDDAEDGAEILDVLVDDMGMILGIETNQTGRYYVVLPCVYYAHQEKARFLQSLKGTGG
jgi:hypothetical protein